jgi:hypothetical protein
MWCSTAGERCGSHTKHAWLARQPCCSTWTCWLHKPHTGNNIRHGTSHALHMTHHPPTQLTVQAAVATSHLNRHALPDQTSHSGAVQCSAFSTSSAGVSQDGRSYWCPCSSRHHQALDSTTLSHTLQLTTLSHMFPSHTPLPPSYTLGWAQQ